MRNGTVSVLEGNTFVVSRRNGDVDAGPAGGYDAVAGLVAHA